MPDEADDAIERALTEQAIDDAVQGLASGDPDKVGETLRDLTATERVEHLWKDGVYQGAIVTYVNPLSPVLRRVYNPYIPMSIVGVRESPGPHYVNKGGYYAEEATVDYFRRHGFPVPPGAPKG